MISNVEVLAAVKTFQYQSGLFPAAHPSIQTGYHVSWLRDNVYTTLGFEATGEIDTVLRTVRAFLSILKKHAYKIDWMIKQPEPKLSWRYIHARYSPDSLKELHEPWGNKQNDAIGALLWRIGDLEQKGRRVLIDYEDKAVVQKLVDYLASIEYWHDSDNGMWEEQEEVHASSIGACVAGLKAVQHLVDVPLQLIQKGEQALNSLLPAESITKKTDLALLSLIYPYNILSEATAAVILRNIEEELVRERGVIRYVGDKYFSNGSEAEWVLGLCWLAVIYKKLGITHKHQFYLRKTFASMNQKAELPELYYGGTAVHNEHTPLNWAQSLLAVATA